MSDLPRRTVVLAALADRVASHFSRDAAVWRPALVRSAAGQPVAVRFDFVAPRPPFAADLLEALRQRLAAPYASVATERQRAGVPIVAATAERAAEATVMLRHEELEDEGAGLSYEMKFAAAPAAVRRGWLSIEDE